MIKKQREKRKKNIKQKESTQANKQKEKMNTKQN